MILQIKTNKQKKKLKRRDLTIFALELLQILVVEKHLVKAIRPHVSETSWGEGRAHFLHGQAHSLQTCFFFKSCKNFSLYKVKLLVSLMW